MWTTQHFLQENIHPPLLWFFENLNYPHPSSPFPVNKGRVSNIASHLIFVFHQFFRDWIPFSELKLSALWSRIVYSVSFLIWRTQFSNFIEINNFHRKKSPSLFSFFFKKNSTKKSMQLEISSFWSFYYHL